MRIAEPRVIRFLNVTGAGEFSPRHASFSVCFSPHPDLNAIDALLLLSSKALCSLQRKPHGRRTQCSSHILKCELIESRVSACLHASAWTLKFYTAPDMK